MLKLMSVICLIAIAFAGLPSFAQDTLGGPRPMPPSNLRILDVKAPDATVQTLHTYFDQYGAGVTKEHRDSLELLLQRFSDADLQYLANGTSPKLLGIMPGSALVESEWRPLVAAYAGAILLDRGRAADRMWSVFLVIVGLAGGVLVTVGSQFLTKRYRGSDASGRSDTD